MIQDHIYISGALLVTHSLDNARRLYEYAADVCTKNGYTPYVPHQHTDPELRADADPREVYDIDSKKVTAAKGVIAFGNEPSFGAGMEIMLAVQHKIPIVCFHHSSTKVSRYLRGFLMQHGYSDVVTYENDTDLAEKIANWLRSTYIQAA